MASIPVGTVTFLFTDIEGSTRLWEQHPDSMKNALARHDTLIRAVVESHDGYVFKTVGDGVCAAFASAERAVAAARAAQTALAGAALGEASALRVRIALHSGNAESRDGDYFGPTLNRAARLMAAGHGGQILLSGATCALAGDRLPPDLELRDLGTHRLKDLARPEHVYQLTVPGLPGEFPPLRTLNARPNNLPIQATPLIGRERELREVRGMIGKGGVRLLTLTGTGGTGKTRLCLQAAADLIEDFDDGVFFVPLAPVADADLVPTAIAQALDVRESAGVPLEQNLRNHLKQKAILLVLDNFEQVVPAGVFVAAILDACPRVHVLITSREVLRVRGEHSYPVPPLDLPEERGTESRDFQIGYSRSGAVRLFEERTAAVKPGFRLTRENAGVVTEICRRLDGLPLCIELAAVWMRVLTPEALLARLENRLAILTRGARDLPSRQRTLEAAIEWSHALLDHGEKRLYRRLGVFVGGFTLEAAEAVCGAGEGRRAVSVLDGVASLADKSLLKEEEREGRSRLGMLETIREYAARMLEESGEGEEMRRLHAAYFLETAERTEPEFSGPNQIPAAAGVKEEIDNLRAALRWFQTHDPPSGMRMVSALFLFWASTGRATEGRAWGEAILEAGSDVPRKDRASVMLATGYLATIQGDLPRGVALTEESLRLYREIADKKGIARSLLFRAGPGIEKRDFEDVMKLLAESVSLSRETGDTWCLANGLRFLGIAENALGGYEQGKASLDESLMLIERAGDRALYHYALRNRGLISLTHRDYGEAAPYFRKSLKFSRVFGDTYSIVQAIENLAVISVFYEGDARRAARLFGAAARMREEIATPLLPYTGDSCEQGMAAVHERLDGATLESLWTEGRAMTTAQVIDDALAGRARE